MSLLNLLFGSTDKSKSFYQLYNKLKDWKSAGVYPFEYNLPNSISFPPDFWKKIIDTHKLTIRDGKERAISLFWADGELVIMPTVTGDEKSVKSNNSVSVKYERHPTKKDYYRKNVLVNNSTYKRVDVYYKKVPKKVEVSYLFNMHTHPQHKKDSGEVYYNFFSAQDIRSFINSNAIVTGLVTNKLYLLFRSNNTSTNVNDLKDSDITKEFLKDNYNMGVYEGEFRSILRL